jgi:hypothetical protein
VVLDDAGALPTTDPTISARAHLYMHPGARIYGLEGDEPSCYQRSDHKALEHLETSRLEITLA